MEHETADTHEEIPKVRDAEDGVVAVGAARSYTFVGKVDEHGVCQGINDLGGVVGQVVVFFAPLEGAGDGVPVAGLVGRRVGDRGQP